MKSWLNSVLLLAAGCLSSGPVAVAQSNILTNGDFESDLEGTTIGGTDFIDTTTITGWRVFAVGGATASATVTSAAGKNGKGIELVRTSPGGADAAFDKDDPSLRQLVAPEERIYKLTVDARDGGEFGTPEFGAELQFNDSSFNRTAVFNPGPDFETFGLTVRSDAGGSMSARFGLFGPERSVHFDNAVVVDATSGVNRMVNGGFENSATSLTNWRFFDTTGVSGTATLSSDARSGARAALLNVTADPTGGDIGLDIDPARVATISGEELTLSFAAKTVAAPSSDTRLRATLAGFDLDGNFVGNFFNEDVNPPTSAYEPYSFEFDVPDGVAVVNVGFRVFDQTLNVPTTGGYLIDDVSLLREPDTPLADFDMDMDVDGNDLLLIQRGLGMTTTAQDISNWKAAFGLDGGVTAVPEPAALRLGGLAVLGLGGVRRRVRSKCW
jgi:hypothetical protein